MQPLRDFLEIPYDRLEEMNLEAKAERLAGKPLDKIREARTKYLADEKRIKRWRRTWKDEMITKLNPEWKDLSEGWYDRGDLK